MTNEERRASRRSSIRERLEELNVARVELNIERDFLLQELAELSERITPFEDTTGEGPVS